MRNAPAVSAAFGSIVALIAFGCEPAATAQPLLTDPTEVVMAGVRSTAALHATHARIELGFDVPGGGGMDGQTIEIDADLDTRSFAGRSVSSSGDGADFTSEFIWVGGQQLTRTPPDERWTALPNFGGAAPFPSNDQLVAIIAAVIEGDGVDARLAQPEACAESTCYHVIVDLDPDATWQLLAPIFIGGPANGPPPDGVAITPTTIDVYVNQATRALIAANTTIAVGPSGVRLSIVLTNHDVPVQFAVPPPDMIDRLDFNNVGGGGMLHADATAAPEPAPAETP